MGQLSYEEAVATSDYLEAMKKLESAVTNLDQAYSNLDRSLNRIQIAESEMTRSATRVSSEPAGSN